MSQRNRCCEAGGATTDDGGLVNLRSGRGRGHGTIYRRNFEVSQWISGCHCGGHLRQIQLSFVTLKSFPRIQNAGNPVSDGCI
jgi:hypothetical protein